MPLPASDPDEVMPKDLQAIAEGMRKGTGNTSEWWQAPGYQTMENRRPMTWWMTSNTSLITTKSSDSSTLKEQHLGRYAEKAKKQQEG